ncbi:uncharacterized protein LOC114293571 [Camellia sinensis]|uniref:uncharacterized protein LOC114293571 n=1 Tax=Camellia sinensis TaxID=4442 RepID=UPI00103611FF|nr:uncharacterized protein LOC114293571 [Camellia sinensis]
MTKIAKHEYVNHPLYLHHSDKPGVILISQPLTEYNYSTWSRAMVMALSAKNKIGFIDGSITKPDSTLDISASVIYYDVTYKIWIDLKDLFSHDNIVHLFHIESEIHDCIQDTKSIDSYFTKLKGLWDEHYALCLIPACNCGTMKTVLEYQQSQKTMKFLIGLNESYVAIRGQILLMDPFPTINRAYSLVLQHERQCDVSTGKQTHPEATTLAVRNNSNTNDHRNFRDTNKGSIFALLEIRASTRLQLLHDQRNSTTIRLQNSYKISTKFASSKSPSIAKFIPK